MLFIGVSSTCSKLEKHDLVVPLVNALGKKTFESKSLKDVAIRVAFEKGADGGNQDIVGVILRTSRSYL